MKNRCPVCGKESEFGPFGSKRRERVLCPVCGTVERHRLLYFYFRIRTNFFRDELSVAHFSPNAGLRALFSRLPNLRYTVVNPDYVPAVDLTDTKLPSSSFDVLICYQVLEHVRDDRKAMSELHRILRPGGWGVVQVPLRREDDTLEDPQFAPEERARQYGQCDHVRFYGRRDFVERLRTAGFDVEVAQPALHWSEETIERYRLVRDEEIYVLKRPSP